MESEGLGEKPPAPKQLTVEPHIVGACVEWAKACAEYRGYGKRSDRWGKGLARARCLYGGHHVDSNCCGLAMGKVAEWYVAGLFGVSVDLRFRPLGDGGVDLVLPCGTSQVKNSSTYHELLVKVGSRELHAAVWFIATQWNGLGGILKVLGYAHRQQVLSSPIESGAGPWKNHAVYSRVLKPISTLLKIPPISEVL